MFKRQMTTHQQFIASTASPYKFPRVAVSAVTGKDSGDDFKAVEEFAPTFRCSYPSGCRLDLNMQKFAIKQLIAAADMQKAVESYLGV